MQKERHTSTLQGHQHTKDSTRKPQGQGPPKQPNRNHIPLPMPQINCPSAYIGESGRSLGERVKEHFKAPSPIHLHSTTTGHPVDPEQFNIVHKEVNSHSRTIKEAMFICIQDPTLNRNLGKYQLPHIWDHLLQVSPTLQHKPSSHPTTPTPPNPYPPTGSPTPFLLLSLLVGGTYIYGKYTCLAKTHPLYP